MIFVNSMSDLFHEGLPVEFIRRVFKVMKDCRQHTFQVLTKRSERLRELAADFDWPSNVWMGVSVESNEYTYRIDDLRCTPAAVKFLSLEPLVEDVGIIDLSGIDWAIAGGESGPGARRWLRHGCARYAISAWKLTSRSISSNGEASTRSVLAEFWMGGRGISFPSRWWRSATS